MGSGLSRKTSFFDLKLWLLLGLSVGGLIIIILIVFLVWFVFSCKAENSFAKSSSQGVPISKKIKEVTSCGQQVDGVLLTIRDKSAKANSEKLVVRIGFERDSNIDQSSTSVLKSRAGLNKKIRKVPEIEELPEDGKPAMEHQSKPMDSQSGKKDGILQLKPLKLCEIQSSEYAGSGYTGSVDTPTSSNPPISDIGWGQWFTLEDLKAATCDFGIDNVVGEGGYGIVYRGQLSDGTLVAVKNLLNQRKQGRHEFKVEVDTIGRVRHKNLVRLLGCCVEDNYRILVYEYVNNGNLEQWLHGEASRSNSLTWETRIKITLGAARALAYLHEALEPKVVHRDIKASNILLDCHWNSKISDFGMAKLLGDGKSYITTRVMGTFGYVAPEYANTGILNEKSDVYSFGVLLMEIITGQDPVDYCRPVGQVNLVDWLKYMVASERAEELIDPQLVAKPSELELKRTLLVALQCVDVNFWNRPTMGHVVHMLEFEQSPFPKAGHTIGRSMNTTTSTLNENLHQLLAKETFLVQRPDDPSDEVEGEQDT